MKLLNCIALFFTLLFLTSCKTNKPFYSEPDGIVGIWQQTAETILPGELKEIVSPYYKIINKDKTFYLLAVWGIRNPRTLSSITKYGTYKMSKDSIITEHIVGHAFLPELKGSMEHSKIYLKDKNTMILEYKDKLGPNVRQEWKRVMLDPIRRVR